MSNLKISRAAGVILLLAVACFALALFPRLSNNLVGMNGLSSGGSIRVNQSKLPSQPAEFTVQLKRVALPDGTELGVVVDGELYGTVSVSRGSVRDSFTTFGMTGRGSTVDVILADGTVVAETATVWKT